MGFVYDFLFYMCAWLFANFLFRIELFSWEWCLGMFIMLILNGITEKPIKRFLRALGNS